MVRNNAVRPKATPVDTLHIAVPDSAAAKAKAKAAVKAPPQAPPAAERAQRPTGFAKILRDAAPSAMTFSAVPDVLYGSQLLSLLDVLSALRSEVVSSPMKLTQLTVHPLVILTTAALSLDAFAKIRASELFPQISPAGDLCEARRAWTAANAMLVPRMFVIGDAMLETASKVVLVDTMFGRFFGMVGVTDSDLAILTGGVANTITQWRVLHRPGSLGSALPLCNVGSSTQLECSDDLCHWLGWRGHMRLHPTKLLIWS